MPRKTYQVGATAKRRDGTYKKVAPGKWKKVKDAASQPNTPKPSVDKKKMLAKKAAKSTPKELAGMSSTRRRQVLEAALAQHETEAAQMRKDHRTQRDSSARGKRRAAAQDAELQALAAQVRASPKAMAKARAEGVAAKPTKASKYKAWATKKPRKSKLPRY